MQYQTGEGPVDIYLPNRQTLIEVKPFPHARDPDVIQSGRDESAKEQLDRYVHAEIKQEDILRPVDHRNMLDRYCHRRKELAYLRICAQN